MRAAVLAPPMAADDVAWSKMGIREVEQVARRLRADADTARRLVNDWTSIYTPHGDRWTPAEAAAFGDLWHYIDSHARAAEAHVRGRRCPQRAPCRNGSSW